MEDAATDAAAALIGQGVLGALVILLTLACWRLVVALQKAQNDRVDDAKRVAQTLLDLNDKWNASVNSLTQAVDRLATSTTPRSP